MSSEHENWRRAEAYKNRGAESKKFRAALERLREAEELLRNLQSELEAYFSGKLSKTVVKSTFEKFEIIARKYDLAARETEYYVEYEHFCVAPAGTDRYFYTMLAEASGKIHGIIPIIKKLLALDINRAANAYYKISLLRWRPIKNYFAGAYEFIDKAQEEMYKLKDSF